MPLPPYNDVTGRPDHAVAEAGDTYGRSNIVRDDANFSPNPQALAGDTLVSGDADTLAIGATLAQTAALPAGTYRVEVECVETGAAAATRSLIVVLRNAADAADTQVLATFLTPTAGSLRVSKLVVAAGERVRVRQGAAAGAAGSQARAQIRVSPVY